MASVIHKQVVPGLGLFSIFVPEGAKILSVAEQRDCIAVWYVGDLDKPHVNMQFRGVMTGEFVPDDCLPENFLGTVLLNDGRFVLHLWRV